LYVTMTCFCNNPQLIFVSLPQTCIVFFMHRGCSIWDRTRWSDEAVIHRKYLFFVVRILMVPFSALWCRVCVIGGMFCSSLFECNITPFHCFACE
jgi:hypothetical protein